MFERRWQAKQMATTKYVERQIAVAAVVAVEETPFLMAVQRDVGGVQIEHDLAEAAAVSLDMNTSTSRVSALAWSKSIL